MFGHSLAEKRSDSLQCNSPCSNDPLFLSFVLPWLKHLVNVLDELVNVWNRTLGPTTLPYRATYYVS